MIDTVATVERNDPSGSDSGRSYGLLRLRIKQPITVLPGQFAMLKAHGIFEPLLRRAMAYYRCDRDADGVHVEFIYQVLGRGTQALAQLRPGDGVDFLGSLGNTYDIRAARGKTALLVAGGVGSAALFMLAEELIRAGIATRLLIGGASRGDLCGLDDFVELLSEENVIGATVDGSYGEKGFVTAPLEAGLKSGRWGDSIIYACGPDPMLHRVSLIADEHGVPGQLSLEAPMGCGYGVCVGCAVAIRTDKPPGYVYQKVCTEGPIFRHEELHW